MALITRINESSRFGCEVTGSVLGIVGMGAIGKQLAMRAKGFRMHCLYWSRTRQSEQIERELHLKWCVTLDELLGHSDTVVLAVTCGTETFDMISEPQLKAMKSSSLLVNVARGKVVNTDALVRALQQNEIAMAALDVTEPEPLPAEHPLLALPNVVLTPHLGTATKQSRLRMLRMAIQNLEAGLEGKELPYCVNNEGLKT
eukprot:TRINITY_DN3334_c0_g1_i8.p2 TRINITY_DN3334_c0_g1~~TRINITY_DN3334_c0_g1_i8.p2  ORF type:complete len:201 (-),score=40.87 TRINITY_DN3334_c0_g1_i8:267-869(-)